MDTELIIEKVLEFLETVISPTIRAGFELAVRRSFVLGIFWNILTVILILFILFGFKYILKQTNNPKHTNRFNDEKELSEGQFLSALIIGAFIIVFVIILAAGYENNFRTFVPEWYAIMDIINLIK